MSGNYYRQSDAPGRTLTVSQLIERLQALDPDAPVIFRSPEYGVFGSNTEYGISVAAPDYSARQVRDYPASTFLDDETGEEVTCEAWTQIFHEWKGVVIS